MSTAGGPMAGYKVGYFVGSLATTSINRLLAHALVKLAPPELHLTEISFKNLPLYSHDYDKNYPPVATAFKDAIATVDAILFVTPEYNRSIPGGLKNAIDWASRPYGKNAFARKLRHHRYIAGQDRHGHCPAAFAQHSRLLQFTADEFRRGVRAVRTRPDYRRWARHRRVHRAISPAIHRGVRWVHREGVYSAAAESVAAVPSTRRSKRKEHEYER